MAKKKPKRPAPFSLHFDDGVREIAERRAEESYRGNITAYLNELVKADGKRNSDSKSKQHKVR